MRYPAYEEYKDSGIEWLGQIPIHWQTKRFKFMARIKNGKDYKQVEVEEPGYPVIGSGGQFAYASKYLFNGESVLLGRKGTIDKPRYINGKFWTVDTMFYSKINKDEFPKFLYYCALTIKFDFYSTSTAVPSMTQEDLGNNVFFHPPIEEQTQIAAFLDRETAKIDTLIAKQEELIALLGEKRTAVISTAVTKGLNPHAPLKDSGIEWLGQIPAHWGIKRLKHISPRLGVGLVINPSTYVSDKGRYFLYGGNIIPYGFKLEDARKITPEDSEKLHQSRLYEGDLVCVRVGYPGVTAVITKELDGANCASVMVVRRGKYQSDWLCYAMNSWIGMRQVENVQYGAAQKQFNIADAVNFTFPVPPESEQIEIHQFLASKKDKFDELMLKATQAIELLKERRTALISATVTGKIDVSSY